VPDICTPICIIFVGSHKPSHEWLKTKAKPLVVRRERVCRATTSEEQEMLTSRYEHPEDRSENNDHEETAFENAVVTDVDGDASSNQLRAAAVRHVKEKGRGHIKIPHDSRPVNEFFNPDLIYPTLYPYGMGGFEDHRRELEVPASLKRHVKHLFNMSDRRFQEHRSFMFTVFNILQRRAILLHKHKSKGAKFRLCGGYIKHDLGGYYPNYRVAHGDAKSFQNEDERKVLQLLKEVNVCEVRIKAWVRRHRAA